MIPSVKLVPKKRAPVFKMGTAPRLPNTAEDVVLVEVGGKPYTLTRGMMHSRYEPRSFFSAAASNTWAENTPMPAPPRALEASTDKHVFHLSLPEARQSTFEDLQAWLRDGKLDENLDDTKRSAIRREAKYFCMPNLKVEVKHIYPKREAVRKNPTTLNTLELADTLSPSLEPKKLAKYVRRAVELDDVARKGLHAFVRGQPLADLTPEFLRAVRPWIFSVKLCDAITAHLKTVDGASVEEEPAEEMLTRIQALGVVRGDAIMSWVAEDQPAFVTRFLAGIAGSPEQGALLEALLPVNMQYTARVEVLHQIALLQKTPAAWLALAKICKGRSEQDGLLFEALIQLDAASVERAEFLAGLSQSVRNWVNLGGRESISVSCHGLRVTYAEMSSLCGVDHLDRIVEGWQRVSERLPTHTACDQARNVFFAAHVAEKARLEREAKRARAQARAISARQRAINAAEGLSTRLSSFGFLDR